MKVSKILDNETIDNSLVKRDVFKIHHQQSANINDSDQIIEFIFGENDKYHQFGSAYFQYEMTKGKVVAIAANRVFVDGDVIRSVNNAFAYCFKERACQPKVAQIEKIKKKCGQVSAFMRALTSKDGDNSL